MTEEDKKKFKEVLLDPSKQKGASLSPHFIRSLFHSGMNNASGREGIKNRIRDFFVIYTNEDFPLYLEKLLFEDYETFVEKFLEELAQGCKESEEPNEYGRVYSFGINEKRLVTELVVPLAVAMSFGRKERLQILALGYSGTVWRYAYPIDHQRLENKLKIELENINVAVEPFEKCTITMVTRVFREITEEITTQT